MQYNDLARNILHRKAAYYNIETILQVCVILLCSSHCDQGIDFVGSQVLSFAGLETSADLMRSSFGFATEDRDAAGGPSVSMKGAMSMACSGEVC